MTKTAVVTGSSRGLGRAITEYLIKDGWMVVGLSRSEDSSHNLGSNYIPMQVDISNSTEVMKAFDLMEELNFKPLDLLVNNASVFDRNLFIPFDKTSDVKTIDAMIDINVKGTMYVTGRAVNNMGVRKGGKIIFINSVAGIEEIREQAVYCASKHAIKAFAGVIGNELRSWGIKVASIHPGGINTTMWNIHNPYPAMDVTEALSCQSVVDLVDLIVKAAPNVEYKTVKMFPTVEWH